MSTIVEIGSKQFTVAPGDKLYIEKLDVKENDTVTFDNVLLKDGNVGTPYIKGAKVTAKVVKHGKQKKVIVFKYKTRKGYKKKQGHRQLYTLIEIVTA